MNIGFIVALVILGLVLLLAEIFLIPGVGIAGLLGIASLVGSSVYAFIEVGNTTGLVISAVNVALLIVLTIYALRAKTWKKATLNTNIDAKAMDDVVISVGDEGKTSTRLAPMGHAFFGTRSIEVKALEGMIDPNVDVVVVMIDDNKVYVKPKEEIF
jgi:membrane-bound ClpP family serine protease